MKSILTNYSLILLLFISVPNYADTWEIIPEQSSITFHGTNSGSNFNGIFKSWNGNITFDPKDLSNSNAFIYIDLSTVETNNNTYNTTLATTQWFDSQSFPKAMYKTTNFSKDTKHPNQYIINGELSIKNISAPIIMNAEIIINNDTATLKGHATINRLHFDIGKTPDSEGNWVSANIPIDLVVFARKNK